MKQFLLLILLAALPQLAHAQASDRLFDRDHYLLDTFRFHDTQVLKQRYPKEYLASFLVSYKPNTEELLVYNINQLQGQLDQMSSYIIDAKDIFYNVENGKATMYKIHGLDTTYDLRKYQREMDFYKKISDDRYNEKEELKRKAEQEKADKLAKEEAEKQQKLDSTQYLKDRIQGIYDSMDNVEFERQKAYLKVYLLKKYGPVNGRAISNGEIRLGMTRDMCELSWGKPLTVIKTTTKTGVIEKWAYDEIRYITFKNGRVTAIHEGGMVEQ